MANRSRQSWPESDATVRIGNYMQLTSYHVDMMIASGGLEPATSLSGDERGLLLRIARCPLIPEAVTTIGHCCHRVVAAQTCSEPERQVPEGWAGNLGDARVVFVSSNPSISLPASGQPEAVEPYPTVADSDDDIAGFLGRRFDPAVRPLPYVKDSRALMRSGEYAQPTAFWREIQARAEELLPGTADPARNYVMTEVVHCKSLRNAGAAEAAGTCAGRYLHDIAGLTAAPIVVVMGKIAQRVIRNWFPELTEPPSIYPQAVLGGRLRTFLFTGQPGSSQQRRIADLYGPSLEELQQIASAGE